MAIDDDLPLESAREKAKRIWTNEEVRRKFLEALKASKVEAGPSPELAPPQIANAIKSD